MQYFPSHSSEQDKAPHVVRDLWRHSTHPDGKQALALPSVPSTGCHFTAVKFLFLEVVKGALRLFLFAGLWLCLAPYAVKFSCLNSIKGMVIPIVQMRPTCI